MTGTLRPADAKGVTSSGLTYCPVAMAYPDVQDCNSQANDANRNTGSSLQRVGHR